MLESVYCKRETIKVNVHRTMEICSTLIIEAAGINSYRCPTAYIANTQCSINLNN